MLKSLNLKCHYSLHIKYLNYINIFFVRSILFLCLVSVDCSFEIFGKAKDNIKESVELSGLIFNPSSGKKPNSIVVLFHGYGDTAENFLFLGVLLSELLPNTIFVAIEGPLPCKTMSSGKQWLSASQNNKIQLLKEIEALTLPLHRYLDKLLKKHDIPEDKLTFLGFSQGARIALHIGLRRPKCAGIVAFSGSYLDDPKAMNLSKPPILIIHGDADKKAPITLAKKSYESLNSLKMPVTLIILPKVAHYITPQGIAIAGEFLRECLGENIIP